MPAAAERDLLFGLLALQNTLIDQEQLLGAFRAWSGDRSRSLADHMAARGALDAADRAAVEALLARHLKKHGGDTQQSLAALAVGASTRDSLITAASDDLQATLTHVAAGSTVSGDSRNASFTVAPHCDSNGQRYRILRLHARGGLGAVYVARDGELNRDVALKQLLDTHADDPTSRQRFLLEAEITGGLEHPGVVPVYGLGVHPDGRPFYAMRFVRGESLKESIERFHSGKEENRSRDLELRRLLRRFLDVCNAIDYAHSRRVLHRDIKPANIIIGKYGETLVVDWGLAKPLGRPEPGADRGDASLPPASASSSAETMPGSALGTPAYMSPEQARGELAAVGPRSDVYSLGATLYSLLTGRQPVEGSDVPAILAAVRDGRITPPRQVDRGVDPALEAICLKAMALRPEVRYESPKALVDDVERWLADEPVGAYPSPWTDRLRRRLKRHRMAVTALGVAMLVALAASATIAFIENRSKEELTFAYKQLQVVNRQAELDRDSADRSFRQAREAVNQFFTRVSEERLLNQPGMHPLRKALLQDAQPFYETFVAERANNPALRADLAVARARLAKINATLGADAEADRQFEQAITLWSEVIAHESPNKQHIHNFAQALNEQGVALMRRQGRRDEAVRVFTRGLDLLRPILDDSKVSLPRRRLYAMMLANKAWTEQLLGQSNQSLTDIRQAIEIDSQIYADDSSAIDTRLSLANQYELLAQISIGRAGGTETALQALQEAVSVLEPVVHKHPELADEAHALASHLGDLSHVQLLAGQPDAALDNLNRAYQILERVNARFPGVRGYQGTLASTLNMLADFHRRRGNYEQSLAYADEGKSQLERLAADFPGDAYVRVDLAKSYNNMGRCLQHGGKNAEALDAFEQAVASYTAVDDLDPRNTYNLACNLSLCVPLAADAEARDDYARRALATLRHAVDTGYINADIVLSDTDLDPLHPYHEYQALLLDLSMPQNPIAR